jgi:hypothetical protein
VDGASVAIGYQALQNAVGGAGVGNGDSNNAVGNNALQADTTGYYNNGFGWHALASVTTGANNTAFGDNAGSTIIDGNGNVAVGSGAGFGTVHAHNVIAIGVPAAGPYVDASNTCFIGSIDGESTSDPGSTTAVLIDSNNVLGTMVSSRRYKHDIKPMDKVSEAILALKPVTFKYNSDAKGTPCFGLIAEEVAEVDRDLVVRDKEGQPQTVRYEQINAMLLNEFLKEHRKVEQMQKQLTCLRRGYRR